MPRPAKPPFAPPSDPSEPPLRIAVFANTLPPLGPAAQGNDAARHPYGGVEVACLALTKALAARGHEVWVFASTAAEGTPPPKRGQAVDEGRWHARVYPRSLKVGQTPVAAGLLRHPGRELPVCDVVLAYMGDQPAPSFARRWARKWKAPLVVSFHGDPVADFGGALRRLGVWAHERRLGPSVLRSARAIIALSEAAKASARLLAAQRAKVVVVPNGVDAGQAWTGSRAEARKRNGLAAKAHVVLFVGALSPIKGVDVLLDAWAKAPAGKDALLLVAGDGPARADLEAQAARLGLAADRVRFLGFVPAAAAGLFAAADAFVLPSRSESFPLSILEAGLAGLPVVASDLPALRAMVEPGVTGLLVPPEDAAALASALRALFERADGGKPLGAAGRAWALRHTWPAVAHETEVVLRAALDPA